MRTRLFDILALSVSLIFCASCMEYDMSYPRTLAEFTQFAVAEAEDITIDPSTRTVNITLKESGDLANVKIDSLKLNDKAFFKDGEMPSVLDLTAPYRVTLSMYQDYVWTIKAQQPVERYVSCLNQVGAAFFDVNNKEAYVYVSSSQLLKYLQLTDMKLELEGAQIMIDGQECQFPFALDCTNKRSFEVLSRGDKITWTLTAVPVLVPATITKIAPWCWSADIYATFDGTSEPPVVMYKKVSDEQWLTTTEEEVIVDGINVTASLRGLDEGTEYETKLIFEGEELPGETFVTDRPLQLPNMNFDQWWLDGAVWYPFAQDTPESDKVWDSANKGAAQFIGSSTTPEESDVIGGKAVKMVSKWAAVKFAAGNLYTGHFNGLVGMSGADLDWGVPFTSKPKALKGWYKYEAKPITRKNNAEVPPTEMDKCQLQVLLIDTERPYKVLPVNGLNGPTYDGALLDLATEPSVIARFIINLDSTDKDGDGSAEWVEFEFPLEYRDYRTPKYVIVTAASSYLGDYFTGGEGSTMYIDEFEFVYE
jgi:hypothetical protein